MKESDSEIWGHDLHKHLVWFSAWVVELANWDTLLLSRLKHLRVYFTRADASKRSHGSALGENDNLSAFKAY